MRSDCRVAVQARQRTDGAMDVDDPEADAGSHFVQVLVARIDEDIITPAPGSLCVGRRRQRSQVCMLMLCHVDVSVTLHHNGVSPA